MLRGIPPILGWLLVFAASHTISQVGEPGRFPTRPVSGTDIFFESCAACHGGDGRGHGPASSSLRNEVPDLTLLSRRNGGRFPIIRVKQIIIFGKGGLIPAHGSQEMPMWGPIFHEIEDDRDLGNVRLENLTEYLSSIQRK